MRALWVAIGMLVASDAAASTVTGTVYLDRDGDGAFSAADAPIAGARVAWDTTVATETDAQGRYVLTVPDAAPGIVWVSVPEGGRPGPVWASVPPIVGEVTADLGVAPLDPALAAAPLTFVVAADTHLDGVAGLWTPDDVARALAQALPIDPPPRFFTVLGDVTQANRPEDFAAVDRALGDLTAPWVPVPGNHDWYDGGAAYRATWGPDSYSFETGGVHFVVWNQALSGPAIADFLRLDLAGVPPERRVVAFGHAPPDDALAAAMKAAGVDALFTGHWHANRVLDHDGLPELGTQPFVMGGIDLSPAGYRVVTIDAAGVHVDHHTFVDEPVLRVVWPTAARCVPAEAELLVALEAGSRDDLRASIDGAEVTMERAGGWLWRARLDGLADGAHVVEVTAGGSRARERFEVCDVEADTPLASLLDDWPQQQRGPEHAGAAPTPPALPYAPLWAAAVGGHLHQSAPIVDDGRVFVAASDFAGGDRGGLVALDLATGRRLWRFPTRTPVRGSPAAADGSVVVATTDGVVHAVSAATGAPRWRVDLGDGVDATQSTLWAAPAIRDDVVYLGTQRRLAAIDLASGRVRWAIDPAPDGAWLGSFAAVAVTEDAVIGAFNRTSGLAAWSRADGAPRWRLDTESAKAINSAPVVADGRVLAGNGWGDAFALDLVTGRLLWQSPLVDGSHDWAYAIAGNLAYADGRLFVPTQWGGFHAVDARTGAVLWTHSARRGVVRTAHYRGAQPGFQASPVVTGDVVWIADTSGVLVALDVATGDERFAFDLGAPVLGGLAVAGELLLVPTWGGTVHAFAPLADVAGARPHDRTPLRRRRPHTPGLGELLLVLAVAGALYRRR